MSRCSVSHRHTITDYSLGVIFFQKQLYAIDEALCQSNLGAAQKCAEEYDARLKGERIVVVPTEISANE